ncbi:MAG: hypothetical protein KAH38_03700 [Candidatus Hydrogenedentes bacterium]|nr:hypothetical protein [Candidatus Hydrogenedentota bacterium]
MANIWESIREFLLKLFIGNDTQQRIKTLNAMEDRFRGTERDNEDSIRELKEDIKKEENRIRKLKKELDNSRGTNTRIVTAEIERIFRGLDRTRGRENVIASNLERINVALAKVAEAKAALNAGVSEDEFDDIAVEIQDLFGSLKTMDRAAKALELESYSTPQTATVDAKERMEEITEEKGTEADLSEEMKKRLKELELE